LVLSVLLRQLKHLVCESLSVINLIVELLLQRFEGKLSDGLELTVLVIVEDPCVVNHNWLNLKFIISVVLGCRLKQTILFNDLHPSLVAVNQRVDVVRNFSNRQSNLLHRIEVSHRHSFVLKRIEVDRQCERYTTLIRPRVPLAH